MKLRLNLNGYGGLPPHPISPAGDEEGGNHETDGLEHLPAHVPDVIEGQWGGREVAQELMRHANITATMNIYRHALTPAKRRA